MSYDFGTAETAAARADYLVVDAVPAELVSDGQIPC